MASSVETPGWPRSYGQTDRRRTYQSKFSRVSSFDSPSSRYSGDTARQSRYDTLSSSFSSSTTSTRSGSRSRLSSSVDRDVGREADRYLASSTRSSKRAYSVDRDADLSSSSASKVRPWRERLKMADQRRRAGERSDVEGQLRRVGSSVAQQSATGSGASSHLRSYSVELASRDDYRASAAPSRKTRAASLSRVHGDASIDFEGIIASAQRKRASSISSFDDADDIDVPPRRAPRVVTQTFGVRPKGGGYGSGGEVMTYEGESAVVQSRLRSGRDIGSFVFRPGEKFEPERVQVMELPSGRRAVTYTSVNEYGHGDRKEASRKINEVAMKTKLLEQSVSTLEDFVKRNRSYFPEDTTIYQQIRFYQLNEEQLREIGESPDAQVYGVKVREKLVVPPGTDVGHILSRYKNTEVDVEYSTRGAPTTTLREEGDQYTIRGGPDDIRRQVEAEFDMREKQRYVVPERYEVRAPPETLQYPQYTPTYTQPIYRDLGSAYDDLYQRSSQSGVPTSPSASLPSDIESIRSSVSSRRRTFDSVPNFTSKLRNKQCMVGQTVKFNCSVSGLPQPEITWFRGNRIINEGGRFSFSSQYGLLSLEIAKVTKEDAGLYTVKAVNSEGEMACSASLDVIEVGIGRPSPTGVQKPAFISEAANTAAPIGGRAVFEARSVGRPTPTFKWYRDNIPVAEGPRVKIYEDFKGNSKLVLSDVRHDDAGLYFLNAENKGGKAKCAATLRVVEPSALADERHRPLSREGTPTRRRSWSREATPTLDLSGVREKGTKPYFIQAPPIDVRVREGEPLTLRCMVDGDPKPVVIWSKGTIDKQEEIAKVTWCKGVRELQYTERHRVVTEGDHYMMQVKTTTHCDRGQYIIIAENAVGRIHASCWVSVLPSDADLEGDDIEFTRFDLDLPEMDMEITTKTEQGKQAPMFVKRLPRERTVSAGSSLELTCTVREATPEVVTATSYMTKVTGEPVLRQETVRIGAEGGITKTSEEIGGETSPAAAVAEAQEETVHATTIKKPPRPQAVPVPKSPSPEVDVAIIDEPSPEPVKETTAEVVVEEVIEPVATTKAQAELAMPVEEITKAAEEASKPAEAVPKQAEEVSKPAEEVSRPTGEVKKAAEEVLKPAEEAPEPAKEVPKPADEAPKPAEEIPKPAEEVPKPAEAVPKSAEAVPKPVEEVPKPEEEVLKPAKEVEKPVEEVVKPTEVPVVATEKVAAKTEPQEVVEEEIVADKIPKKAAPAPEEATISVTEADEVEATIMVTEEAEEEEQEARVAVVEEAIVAEAKSEAEKAPLKATAEAAVEETQIIKSISESSQSQAAVVTEEKATVGETQEVKVQVVEEVVKAEPQQAVETQATVSTSESSQAEAQFTITEPAKEEISVEETQATQTITLSTTDSSQAEATIVVEELTSEATPIETTATGSTTVEVTKEVQSTETAAEEAHLTIQAESKEQEESKAEATISLTLDEGAPAATAQVTSAAAEATVIAAERKAEELVAEIISEGIPSAAAAVSASEQQKTIETVTSEISQEGGSTVVLQQTTSAMISGVPAGFAEKLRSLIVAEGATATFKCSLNEGCEAKVIWSKDGEPLTSGGNLSIAAEGLIHTVTITNVKKSDEGCYACSATNDSGSASCSATLSIQSESVSTETVTFTEMKSEEGTGAQHYTVETKTASKQEFKTIQIGKSDSESEASELSESESESESEFTKEPRQSQTRSRATHAQLGLYKLLPTEKSELSSSLGHLISLESHHDHTDPLHEMAWVSEGRQ